MAALYRLRFYADRQPDFWPSVVRLAGDLRAETKGFANGQELTREIYKLTQDFLDEAFKQAETYFNIELNWTDDLALEIYEALEQVQG